MHTFYTTLASSMQYIRFFEEFCLKLTANNPLFALWCLPYDKVDCKFNIFVLETQTRMGGVELMTSDLKNKTKQQQQTNKQTFGSDKPLSPLHE